MPSQNELTNFLNSAIDLSEKLATRIAKLEKYIKDVDSKYTVDDEKTEKVAMRLAAKLATLEKGDKGDSYTPTEEDMLPFIIPIVEEKVATTIDEKVKDIEASYTLTPKDKKEIAGMIDIPVVEKTIKEVTTIREVPIVTENVKEVAMYEEAEVIVAKINELPTDDDSVKIDARHIKNLPQSQVVHMGGGGGGSAFGRLKVEGELDAVATNTTDSLTFVAGSNMTITTDSGSKTVTFASSGTGGGGSGYQAASSGTVDGSNTVFTWSSAPSVIVVDSVPKRKTQSDGTVNWTGTTTTTLSVAPNFDIFGL